MSRMCGINPCETRKASRWDRLVRVYLYGTISRRQLPLSAKTGRRPHIELNWDTTKNFMMKNCVVVLLLCVLAGCSSKEPSAQDIAGILSVKGDSFTPSAGQISNLNCTKSTNEYNCKFLIDGKPAQMRLMQIGGGSFTEIR